MCVIRRDFEPSLRLNFGSHGGPAHLDGAVADTERHHKPQLRAEARKRDTKSPQDDTCAARAPHRAYPRGRQPKPHKFLQQ
jgi:hypothetical protein